MQGRCVTKLCIILFLLRIGWSPQCKHLDNAFFTISKHRSSLENDAPGKTCQTNQIIKIICRPNQIFHNIVLFRSNSPNLVTIFIVKTPDSIQYVYVSSLLHILSHKPKDFHYGNKICYTYLMHILVMIDDQITGHEYVAHNIYSNLDPPIFKRA